VRAVRAVRPVLGELEEAVVRETEQELDGRSAPLAVREDEQRRARGRLRR